MMAATMRMSSTPIHVKCGIEMNSSIELCQNDSVGHIRKHPGLTHVMDPHDMCAVQDCCDNGCGCPPTVCFNDLSQRWLRPFLGLRAIAFALRVGLAFAPLMA